jgi:hypothetical protein
MADFGCLPGVVVSAGGHVHGVRFLVVQVDEAVFRGDASEPGSGEFVPQMPWLADALIQPSSVNGIFTRGPGGGGAGARR